MENEVYTNEMMETAENETINVESEGVGNLGAIGFIAAAAVGGVILLRTKLKGKKIGFRSPITVEEKAIDSKAEEVEETEDKEITNES